MSPFSSALVLLCGLSFSYAFQSFQSQIPNGDAVPNPCTTNAGDVWNGVGHEAVGGAGARNPFGLAFAAAGNTWTADFCAADSDSDGVTNGAELGDPECAFVKDGNAASGNAVSHPGICEPVTSDDCKTKNSWLTTCAAAEVDEDDDGDDPNSALSVTTARLITLIASFIAAFM